MYNTVNTQEEKKLSSGSDYERALQAVQAVRDSLPDYSSVHDDALRGLYEEIANRPKFSYDPNGDALYQSYKRSYAQQGRLAMTDTMGQAASLTGGYGSSYAQSVGQQQYDAYLQKLGEVLPETYGMAYQQYRDEGNALQQQYDMVSQLAEEDYQKYLDRLDTYYRELNYAQERADVAYDRQTREEQTAYDRKQDTLNRQSKEYDRGIAICGTGMGVSIIANKFRGVYAALCECVYTARRSKTINNSNVLCMGGFVVGNVLGCEMANAWLEAEHLKGLDPAEKEKCGKESMAIPEAEVEIYGE